MTRAVLVALVLVLAGCGGDDSNAAETTTTERATTEAATTTEATTTTVEDPAVLRAYIADLAPAIASWREDYDSQPRCSAGGCRPFDGINLLGFSLSADALIITIDLAVEDHPPPPADVAQLLDDLQAGAEGVKEAYSEWSSGPCSIPASASCQPLLVQLERDIDAMDDVVVRWETLA